MEGKDTDQPGKLELEAAFREVYADFFAILNRRLNDEVKASDILHDFFVKVLTNIGDLRASEKLIPWMRRVLETTLMDHFRNQARQIKSEAEFGYLETVRLSGEGLDDIDLAVCLCLHRLLATINPGYADLIWRAELIGQPRDQIAAELKLSDGNLRVRLHRARQAIKLRLEETCRSCPIHGYLNCDCELPSAI